MRHLCSGIASGVPPPERRCSLLGCNDVAVTRTETTFETKVSSAISQAAPHAVYTLSMLLRTLRTPSAPPHSAQFYSHCTLSPTLLLKGLAPSAPSSAALPCPPQPNVRYPLHKMYSPHLHHQAKESSRSFHTALVLLMLALMATHISWLCMATWPPGAAASYRSTGGAVAVVPKHSGDGTVWAGQGGSSGQL